MKNVVLDSSALVAYLEGEPGRRVVKDILTQARRREIQVYISAMNLSEVVYAVARGRGRDGARRVAEWLPRLPLTVEPIGQEDAVNAGLLRHRYGLSYGDCFAISLAHRLGGELLASDPDFQKVQDVVRVVWIR